jgi:hypothetical protein
MFKQLNGPALLELRATPQLNFFNNGLKVLGIYFSRRHENLFKNSSGTDVMTLKIFSPKNLAKNGVFDSKQS